MRGTEVKKEADRAADGRTYRATRGRQGGSVGERVVETSRLTK